MHLITHLIFNQDICSFNLNGNGIELTNAAQYGATKEQYKFRTPHPGTENDRFVLIGDGNYVIKNDHLIQAVAIVILQRVGTNSNYALQRIVFNTEFVLA